MKVAIIGCGQIADAHASQIRRIPDCEIVGVCDRELLMAKQFADRFQVKRYFDDASALLETTKPDVVHITTPPQSHFNLAELCLDAGCCVYVEKPFTLNSEEAARLIRKAEESGRKITVGHNLQFSPVARQMRALIKDGYLGGDPVHMESYYGYELGDVRYAKALLADKNHWVRTLPGKLLHNIISHGISKIAEFLPDEDPLVIVHGFRSPVMKSINETDIIDEVRVIIDDTGVTAYFTFSTQISPKMRLFRIYGPENALVIDEDHQTILKHRGYSYKSYLNQLVPPAALAKQFMANSCHNVIRFITRELHTSIGLKCLIEFFYDSIKQDSPEPIPYREILLTTRIMDKVFEQVNKQIDTEVFVEV